MTDAREVERIARRLTYATLERLAKPEDGNCSLGAAMQFTHYNLIEISADGEGWCWSPLGRAVRAYVEQHPQRRTCLGCTLFLPECKCVL